MVLTIYIMPKKDKQYDISVPVIGVFADSKAITMRLPKEMEQYVLKQPNRSAWLREAVREKMERDAVG
jgi:hypothetical protein